MMTKKMYQVDGCNYASMNDVKLHNEFKENKLVKSFTLPSVQDKRKYSRYGAYKCEINGITFDSVMEGRYYVFLLEQKHSKLIKDFKRQVPYILQPAFTYKCGDKQKKYREISYIADYVIVTNENEEIVIDIKGQKAPEFRIKEKMFYYQHPNTKFYCIQWDNKKQQWRDLDEIIKEKTQRKKERNKNKNKKGGANQLVDRLLNSILQKQ